jgi:hypothetical protein
MAEEVPSVADANGDSLRNSREATSRFLIRARIASFDVAQFRSREAATEANVASSAASRLPSIRFVANHWLMPNGTRFTSFLDSGTAQAVR